MRTYKPTAYAELPARWVEALHDEFIGKGYQVEIGLLDHSHEEAWIRIHGISRKELYQRLNDPLGAPGQQETRHPNPNIRKRKVRPMSESDYLFAQEELRYLRPDTDENGAIR